MKSIRLISLMVSSAIVMPVFAALAETPKIQIGTWREVQPKYEFKHPMTVTCEEFLDADAIYRPYVVAWLSGNALGEVEVTDAESFVPVSVPQVVTVCQEDPDMLVHEVVEVVSADD